MTSSSARFDRTAFGGMALDWSAFGSVSPERAALDRAALDEAARERATKAVRTTASTPTAAVARSASARSRISADPVVARRAAVRGGVVCGSRAPVHRVAVVRAATAEAHGAPAVHGARRRLRLTARGRFVVIVLPLAAMVTGGLLGVAGQQTATASSQVSSPSTSVAAQQAR